MASADRPHILVVDDESAHRELLSFLLSEDYAVISAADGEEALSKAQASPPDVALVDYRMPGQSGVEVLQQLRALYPDCIRFLVTAYADAEVLQDSINLAGIYRFLSKPVDPEVLRVDIARALEHRADRLGRQRAEKLAVLGRIAGSVVHDLNNAMTVMGFLADTLDESSDDPSEIRRSAAELRVIDASMRDLVAELMALVKNTTPVFALELASLGDLVSSAVQIERRTHLYDGRQIDVEIEAGLPAFPVSRSRVRRLVTNLLRNAAAATKVGGKITVRVARVDPEHIALEVADDGAGISPEIQARIFDPLFTTKGNEGAGLGLSICSAVMKGHGGTLTCRSSSGEGAMFTATFPTSHS